MPSIAELILAYLAGRFHQRRRDPMRRLAYAAILIFLIVCCCSACMITVQFLLVVK